jgi:alkane 1-monooxygenase
MLSRDLRYFFSIIPIIFVIIGNYLGSWFTLLNSIFSLIFLVIVDWFFIENRKKPETNSAFIPNSVLLVHVLLNSLAIFTLIYGIYSEIIIGPFIIIAILSTGISSGMSGIIVAHELIHRPQKYFQYLGLWNLWTVNYIHWYIEHIRVHHRFVGIPDLDPATSKYKENCYHFIIRTIPQQFISAYNEEVRFLRKRNKNSLINNFVIKGVIITLITWIILYSIAPVIFLAFIGQSLVAIILLELVNYIEHYGLTRSEDSKVEYEHSWQSDNRFSRFMLLELVRHPDHHYAASKPYQTLESKEKTPVLPSGYWGMFPIALIPPIWFRMIHPRLKPFLSK